MREYYPLLVIGGIVGALSVLFIVAYACIRDKKQAIGFERNMKDSEIIKRLFAYAKPYYRQFLLVLLIVFAMLTYDILSPLIVGWIEEKIKGEFVPWEVLVAVGVYATALLLSLAAMYAQTVILQKTGQKIVSHIREDLFIHIESLSHAQLSALPVGKLVTRITNDANAVSVMFTNIIANLVKNVALIVGVLIAMLCLNYELTLMVLCFAPFIVLFTLIFRKFSRRAYRRVKDGTTDVNTFLSENLSGMKVTQSFCAEDQKMAEFQVKNEKLKKARQGEIFTFGVFRPIVYMLYIASVACLFYLGAKGVIDGTTLFGQTLTGGVIVSFYMYIIKFFTPVQDLAEQFNRLQSAFASAEKIFTLLDVVPSVTDDEGAEEVEHIEGNIEFQHVWFAYTEGEWVLQDVSFTVKAGQTVAFVGATGSGKTTILSLLCRNYDIQKGKILIDGKDIRRIKISSLRKRFGQMLQDVFLFSGTVRSNLTLDEDFSDEEIESACRLVNADSLIQKLPRGLEEEVRERGNNFSAGQRQLLSFARTVLHKPDVLILDEATANIDTETERLIQSSLENMMKIGTMLVVAHRLSTVRNADQIIVLSHGKIVEEGTHASLLAAKGKYYSLYILQSKREGEGTKQSL
jgi:ATP-binding cassette subfamily B protein